MGKYKRLKKEMQHEAARLNSRIDALTELVQHNAWEEAKEQHPSAQKTTNWNAVMEAEMVEAVKAAKERAQSAEHKILPKIVLFKIARSLYGTEVFAADYFQRSQLNQLGVPFEVIKSELGRVSHIAAIRFKPMSTYNNIGDLTKRVNKIFAGGIQFYAEVRGA